MPSNSLQNNKTTSTRERILRAAERVYAEHGYHGMSLREVTDLAQVNLAAVNYHFGSKEKLFFAMADARLVPLNKRRLDALDAAKQQYGYRAIPLQEIVTALVAPMLHSFQKHQEDRAIVVRISAQMVIDDPLRFSHVHRTYYKEMLDRFHWELQRTLPHLTASQVYARFFCAFTAIIGVRLMQQSKDWFLRNDLEEDQLQLLGEEMIEFLIAGFAAGKPSAAASAV